MENRSYPADDVVMVGQVCLAVLAAVDLVGIEVDVVLESHAGRDSASEEPPSLESGEKRMR